MFFYRYNRICVLKVIKKEVLGNNVTEFEIKSRKGVKV
ncbi:MAG: hypothetical protein K0R69_3058 [Clostridia bacterium]|jgi:hypothetical protein|nr:hypothetical protein [Clostridia bacterium]